MIIERKPWREREGERGCNHAENVWLFEVYPGELLVMELDNYLITDYRARYFHITQFHTHSTSLQCNISFNVCLFIHACDNLIEIYTEVLNIQLIECWLWMSSLSTPFKMLFLHFLNKKTKFSLLTNAESMFVIRPVPLTSPFYLPFLYIGDNLFRNLISFSLYFTTLLFSPFNKKEIYFRVLFRNSYSTVHDHSFKFNINHTIREQGLS